MAAFEQARPGPVPRHTTSINSRLALFGFVALTLAACGEISKTTCPRVAILDQTSSLTKFATGGAGAPGDVLFHANMVKAELECSYFGDTVDQMDASLKLALTAERGPALRRAAAEYEFFVVVTNRAGTVLNKRVFPAKFDFGGGRARVNTFEETWQYFRLEMGKSGPSYEIWAGFQLTDAELEFNRSRSKR